MTVRELREKLGSVDDKYLDCPITKAVPQDSAGAIYTSVEIEKVYCMEPVLSDDLPLPDSYRKVCLF